MLWLFGGKSTEFIIINALYIPQKSVFPPSFPSIFFLIRQKKCVVLQIIRQKKWGD